MHKICMLAFLTQYTNYIYLAFIFRILIEIVPKSDRAVVYIYNFRKKSIELVEKIFENKKRLDIVFFTRIIFPFVLFYLIIQFLVIFEFVMNNIYDTFSIVLMILFIVNMIPSVDDIDMLFDTSISSKYFFLAKVVLATIAFGYSITIEGLRPYFFSTVIVITPFSLFVD